MDLSNYCEHAEFPLLTREESLYVSKKLSEHLKSRRTVRHFSDDPVSDNVIINAVKSAGCAPSGANKQPWFFAIVKTQQMKKAIREAAEKAEEAFYQERAPKKLIHDLKCLGTNATKPYLEKASHLIVVFSKFKEVNLEGGLDPTYYPMESVGISTGFLISSLHQSGVATLTHTPKPMHFLNDLLGQPKHYKPLMIVVAGYPKIPILVPKIERKSFSEIASFY